MLHDALVGADEERAGAARGIKDAEFPDFLGCPAFEQAADGLLDDVFDDVARGVINAAGFAHLGLLLDGHAAPLRADDLAEEAFVNVAENLDLDRGEVVAGVVVGEVEDEIGEPLVADDEVLGEVGLEELAVEKGLVARRDGGRGSGCGSTISRYSEPSTRPPAS